MRKPLFFLIIFSGFFWGEIDLAGAEDEISGAPLLLEEVLREVIERNPEILAAKEKGRAAGERVVQARAFEDPQIAVTQWSIPSNFSVGNADETWYTLSQSFPFFGKRGLRGGLADLERRIADEESREVERKIVAAAKQAYYDLFFSYKAFEIHADQVELARRFSRIAQEKFAVGEAGAQDLLRAQVELLDLTNALDTLERERETAAARLNALLDRPSSSPLGVPRQPPAPSFEPSLEALLSEAAENRPENRLLALTARKGEEAIFLAKREYFPDVMAEVAYMDIHDGPNRWMTSLKINIPWINKRKYDARVRESRAERSRAEAGYRAALNETQFKVKDLFVKFETAQRLARLSQDGILPLARQSLEAATIGYQTKKNDFLTLIEAQKNLKTFEIAYYRALIDMHKNLAELEQVVGKDF